MTTRRQFLVLTAAAAVPATASAQLDPNLAQKRKAAFQEALKRIVGDAKVSKGRVKLTSAADTAGKKTQASDFYDGIFQIKQTVPTKKSKKATALTTDIVLKDQLSR